MIRERFRLFLSLGWPGWLGAVAAVFFALVTVFAGIYSITSDDDRMSHWVSFSAIATVLISISLTLAMERKSKR